MTLNNDTAPGGEQPKRDFRQEVTDQIIRMLERGKAPWQKPWEPGSSQLPFNPTTGRGYRGGNALHLMAVATNNGYDDARWLTYRQAQENGWQVKKGEKGTHIEYWQFGERTANDMPAEPADGKVPEPTKDTKDGHNLIHRVYTVFNANQIEGIPPLEPRQPPEGRLHKPARTSCTTPERRSITIRLTAPSTAASTTRSTCRRRKPSPLPPTSTAASNGLPRSAARHPNMSPATNAQPAL